MISSLVCQKDCFLELLTLESISIYVGSSLKLTFPMVGSLVALQKQRELVSFQDSEAAVQRCSKEKMF